MNYAYYGFLFLLWVAFAAFVMFNELRDILTDDTVLLVYWLAVVAMICSTAIVLAVRIIREIKK